MVKSLHGSNLLLCSEVPRKETTCHTRCRGRRRSTGCLDPKEPQTPTMWSSTSTTPRPTWAARLSWRALKTTSTCRWWTTSRQAIEWIIKNVRTRSIGADEGSVCGVFLAETKLSEGLRLLNHLCLFQSQYFTFRPVNLCKWWCLSVYL